MPIDVTPTSSIFINSNFATKNYKVIKGKLSTTSIVASCPIVSPPYGMVIYQDLFGQNSAWQAIEQLDTLRVWLTDDNDQLLPLQSEWTMTIGLERYLDDGQQMVDQLQAINATLGSQLDVSRTRLVYTDLKNQGLLEQQNNHSP